MIYRLSSSVQVIALVALLLAPPATAQTAPSAVVPRSPAYADLADLADSAPLVVRAEVRKLAPLDAARARSVSPGHARYYVEAKTQALVSGLLSSSSQR